MKPQFFIFTICTLTIFTGCNHSDNIGSGRAKTDTIQIKNNLVELTKSTKIDSVSIWVYDYLTETVIRNRKINADTLTPKKIIDFINLNNGRDKINLDFVKISHDTIYVRIRDGTYLTQQMGTAGADDYMTTTTFTLTELKNIKYVNFNFEEGDHASPGTYSRQYYLDKKKRSSVHN